MKTAAVALRGLLVLLLPLSSIVSAGPLRPKPSAKILTLDEALSGRFSASSTSLSWVESDSDGTYVSKDPTTNSLFFSNIVTGENSTFVDATNLKFSYYDYSIQPSQQHVLFATNYTKQYRHSYFASYYIYDRNADSVLSLVDDQVGDIQYAAWSPKGDTIAFIRGNDLYIWNNGTVTRITEDGGPDVFNGIPDWVYEEEIFGDRFTLWFSPDGEYLAFLRFNETGVPTYRIPYYMNDQTVAAPYPRELELRYPKVGATNPTVTFHLLQMNSVLNSTSPNLQEIEFDTFEPEDLVVGEVAWVTDTHKNVIFRTMNRVQDMEKLVLVDVETGSTSVVRERDGTDGWIDNNLAIEYVPGLNSYVDLSDHTGWSHLYLFSPDGDPVPLTSGEWEVTNIVYVDSARKLVYFLSTEHDSTERHLYSVSLITGKKTALVDDTEAAYWDASFSDAGGYYILSYLGPGLPWQKLYSINDTMTPLKVITSNEVLNQTLAEYQLPTYSWFTLNHTDGYSLNVVEKLPANFDPSKKYPVLFTPYGGPSSQQVSKSWKSVGWSTYISSDPELEYITLTVDNRGTGFKGRAFRALVTGQLGKLEAQDQIWAAQEYGKRSYVDEDHMVIWGWSFGGYLTSKVLETNSNVFSMGLITAPVSDWRFYDSMYTERYMKSITSNAAGYNASAVAKPEGFKNVAGGFLLQHGSGDDNVHWQNSAVLVDALTVAGVPPAKMQVQWFTDSDHSIRFHGATRFLYRQLSARLWEEKQRHGERGSGHQWSRRAEVAEERFNIRRKVEYVIKVREER